MEQKIAYGSNNFAVTDAPADFIYCDPLLTVTFLPYSLAQLSPRLSAGVPRPVAGAKRDVKSRLFQVPFCLARDLSSAMLSNAACSVNDLNAPAQLLLEVKIARNSEIRYKSRGN